MKVLMLGWEFPPYISGGLGTACFGLTRALSWRDLKITFVLPRRVASQFASHVELLSPDDLPEPMARQAGEARRVLQKRGVRFAQVPALLSTPYHGPGGGASGVMAVDEELISYIDHPGGFDPDTTYEPDTITQAQRYAEMALELMRGRDFDLIHAHDWPTFPAAIALSTVTGRPWIAHLHSTEFDRSGEHAEPRIYDIERRGMHEADRVITVSSFTKAVCAERYGVNAAKIEVVYNGADAAARERRVFPPHEADAEDRDKIVLFLGRITEQKGPAHFVEAARKVADRVERVRFVMAGSGDLARPVIDRAVELGLGGKFTFTGFLRGDEVDRVFDMADVYVMPSVSEPFGIAPLEAINHQVPVVISRQSGVSEVLRHALKVDFWNTDDLADKIIAVLRHPPLREELRENALAEVRELTWDGAAAQCHAVYEHALAAAQR